MKYNTTTAGYKELPSPRSLPTEYPDSPLSQRHRSPQTTKPIHPTRRKPMTTNTMIMISLQSSCRPTLSIMDKMLKFMQLNKCVSDLESRVDQINSIIDQHKPHAIVINELNSPSTDKITRNQFPGYHLETDNLDILDTTSRTGILIHRDLHYSRRLDLETPGTFTVWVQFKYPGRKPLLLQGIYRQFQRIGIAGSINPTMQHQRWEQIILKWEKAIEEGGEIITLGDLNLNTLRWDVPQHLKTQYDRTKQPMIASLRTRILDKGLSVLSQAATKIPNNPDTPPSCIDLMIVNNTEKITSFQAGLPSFSDHTLQVLTRSSKGLQTNKKYARIRSYKNFSNQQYRENLINHPSYIQVLYEQDPEIITNLIQNIIQDSLNPLAPIKVVQITPKTATKLTPEIREAIVDRDLALITYRASKDPEDLRLNKNLRNSVNHSISREKFNRKAAHFRAPNENMNDKWKKIKMETGQENFSSPQTVTENSHTFTSHQEIAESLNRQYVKSVRKLISEIEKDGTDPLINYNKLVQNDQSSFTFTQVSMHQLRQILKNMKLTGSMGEDDLSIKNVKQAQNELEPLLLKLVNSFIKTTKYPKSLKTTKIVPIRKTSKSKTTFEEWRPINVVAALSKIIEHMLLMQILTHLENNNLVPTQHHGSIKNKSTQTLITELHDILLDDRHQGKEGALIIFDQSKAYDCIDHSILIKKMSVIAFKAQAISIMTSFLAERKQVQSHRSSKINIGPNSVIQGSTLSCTLYLIYIMDMPLIFHDIPHTPKQYRDCSQTNLKTYIDNEYLKTYKKTNTTMEDSIHQTMDKVSNTLRPTDSPSTLKRHSSCSSPRTNNSKMSLSLSSMEKRSNTSPK